MLFNPSVSAPNEGGGGLIPPTYDRPAIPGNGSILGGGGLIPPTYDPALTPTQGAATDDLAAQGPQLGSGNTAADQNTDPRIAQPVQAVALNQLNQSQLRRRPGFGAGPGSTNNVLNREQLEAIANRRPGPKEQAIQRQERLRAVELLKQLDAQPGLVVLDTAAKPTVPGTTGASPNAPERLAQRPAGLQSGGPAPLPPKTLFTPGGGEKVSQAIKERDEPLSRDPGVTATPASPFQAGRGLSFQTPGFEQTLALFRGAKPGPAGQSGARTPSGRVLLGQFLKRRRSGSGTLLDDDSLGVI